MNISEKYRMVNLEILKAIENDKENVDLLDKRQVIVDEILSSEKTKEEFKAIYISSGLKELDEELEKKLKDKFQKVKVDIKKLALRKEANKSYSAATRSPNLFSRNI